MNGQAHRSASALAATALLLLDECGRCEAALSNPMSTPDERQFNLGKVLCAGGIGHCLGTLPDILEPAINPNHRKFFHSIAFAAVLLIGYCKVWTWQPEFESHRYLRYVMLTGGAAYLMHLLMDATTPRSLPLI